MAIEILVLCASFIFLIFVFTAKDRRGGLHWYPALVQQKAVERGLVDWEYIGKRKKLTQLIGLAMIAVIVLGFVFLINQAWNWKEAAWQIYVMLFVLNLFDAVVVDWIWVRNTDYWVIEELKDLEIAKPLDYLIKERVIAAVVYIPIAMAVGCIAFLK